MMETIKNIGSIIGLILSCTTLLALCSKTGKDFLISIFKKYNASQDNDIQDLKKSIEGLDKKFADHLADFDEFNSQLSATNEVTLEFIKQQCRNIIKNIFYHYYDEKVLPLYEYKTLMAVKEIYIEQLKGNSYASELIKEMEKWEIDYKMAIEEE